VVNEKINSKACYVMLCFVLMFCCSYYLLQNIFFHHPFFMKAFIITLIQLLFIAVLLLFVKIVKERSQIIETNLICAHRYLFSSAR